MGGHGYISARHRAACFYPERSLSRPLAFLLALAIGASLTFAATRATASVTKGRIFLHWMLAVFVAYVALISLPVLVGL